jgi:adenylosuccinate synthase
MHNIVIGLLFGDEAKGATTDYLCSVEPVDFVVRFSGGPQTAHNVILEDGTHHTFSQFGSGTFRGAKTLLSRFALVNPLNLINEANALEEVLGFDPLSLLFVSENSLMITPLHRRANQTRERQRGAGAHGSCGQGIGESMDYSIRYPEHAPVIGDLRDLPALRRKLRLYKAWVEINLGVDLEDDVDEIIESYTAMMNERNINIITDYQVIQYIKNAKNLVFEGTQGTLLDENFGFHPHTTWSTTTVKNARWLLEAADIPRSQYRVIGAMRTYMTRHGHGPFLSEFPSDYDWSEKFPEPHNKRGVFQGAWRVGHLDLNFLAYAADANDEQVDAIALSHCDVPLDEIEYTDVRLDAPRRAGHDAQQRMTDAIFAARAKREEGESYKMLPITELEDLENEIEFATGAKVLIRSYGPTAANRMWMDPEQSVF